MIDASPPDPERLAVFLGIVHKLDEARLGPGFARVVSDDKGSFTIALTLYDSQVDRALDHNTDLLAEALRIIELNYAASADTHPKDGDAKQAPLVSGAVPLAADAQTLSPKGEPNDT